MTTVPIAHPDPDRLRAYGVGQLADAERRAIEAHLAGCPACGNVLADAPADALVRLVRDSAPAPAATDGPQTRVEDPTAPPTSVPARPPAAAVLDDHPRYRVLSQIGAGGMGVVFLAEHRLMKRRVALKVVVDKALADPDAAARFQREVEIAARLSHPNVVAAHDAEQFRGTTFLVMEYVPGTNLGHLVRNQGPLPVATALGYVRQAARGLQHAHEHGLVHRDLKPTNLMLTPAGEVKVLDFGLVRVATPFSPTDSGGTRTGVVMGTPDYMAPEQAEDSSRVDTRADVYALGCTLYFLLVGREPYPTPSTLDKLIAHKVAPLPDPSRSRADIPPAVLAVLRKMTAKKPADRYQTPAEVVAAVSAVLDGTPDAVTVPVAPPVPADAPRPGESSSRNGSGKKRKKLPVPPPRRRTWRVVAAAALGVFLPLWAFVPVVWEFVPPPPWGDRWLQDHGKKKGGEKEPRDRPPRDKPPFPP